MSDSFLAAINAHGLLNGSHPKSDHDLAVDSALHYARTDHDNITHLAGNPDSFDYHPTDAFPPLMPRTPAQLESLPVQRQTDAAKNPWEFMKADFSRIWNDPQRSLMGKIFGTVAIPSHEVAHELAKATHVADAPDYNLHHQVKGFLEGNRDIFDTSPMGN